MDPSVEGGMLKLQQKKEALADLSMARMLLSYGIAPETLGWVEEEGDFIDN